MALTTKLYAGVQAEYTGAADLGTPRFDLSMTTLLNTLLSGTGASQADKLFCDQRSISASGNDDLDLAGGLTDPLGAVLTFVKVKGILIKAAAANVNNVVVGNQGAAPATLWFGGAAHTIIIPPGGFMFIAAPVGGWTITATSADLLRIANSGSGSSVVYDIVIVGTSA